MCRQISDLFLNYYFYSQKNVYCSRDIKYRQKCLNVNRGFLLLELGGRKSLGRDRVSKRTKEDHAQAKTTKVDREYIKWTKSEEDDEELRRKEQCES